MNPHAIFACFSCHKRKDKKKKNIYFVLSLRDLKINKRKTLEFLSLIRHRDAGIVTSISYFIIFYGIDKLSSNIESQINNKCMPEKKF